MDSCSIKIKRLANGFEVQMTDPDIVKQNQAPSKKGEIGRWRDPEVTYAFKTTDEVMKFLNKNLAKAMPTDEYETSFDAAMKEEDDD